MKYFWIEVKRIAVARFLRNRLLLIRSHSVSKLPECLVHFIIILIIPAALFYVTGCSRTSTAKEQTIIAVPPPVVEVGKPQRRDIQNTVELVGDLQAYQQAMLYAKVSGYLRSVLVDKGDRVNKGELLATLESPELERDVAEKKAGLGKAKADLLSARADFHFRDETYRRLKRVYDRDPGLLAKQDLDMALDNKEVAGAKLDAAAHEAAAAQANLSQSLSLLGYTQIRAPFSGTITKRFLDPGALAQSAANSAQGTTKPILALANFDAIRIFVAVPEPDVPYVHPGSKAAVRVDALPDRLFENRVSRLSGALDPSTRTMLAEVDLPNQKHFLHPGMFAKVTLDLQAHRHALTVPTSAVIFDKDKRFVFVVEKGRAKKVNIKTGFEESQFVEILDGLKGNEEVVVVGKENVGNGSLVQVKSQR